MHPLSVPVASIVRSTGSTTAVDVTAPFDPDGTLAALSPGTAEVVPGADVELHLVLASFLGGISATGTIGVPWRATCRRCARDVGGTLEIHVSERFRPAATLDDDDAYPIVDEVIDLTDLVRDAVVLELPLAPLCREDCEGLCPSCGADRNESSCACEPETDPRWATLDALRVPDQA